MDFLTLCQRTAREAGISGVGPASVTGQTGQLANIVNWVNIAWKDIQNIPFDWKFQWAEYSVDTVASTATVDMSAETVNRVDGNTVTCYLTSAGVTDRQKITLIDYQKFKRDYPRENVADEGRPTLVTMMPDGNLKFYPTPDAIYTIEFEGFEKPQTLAANADVPVLPLHHHEIIIYKALVDHGRFEDALEIRKDVPQRYAVMLRNLEWDQIIDPSTDGFMTVVPQ